MSGWLRERARKIDLLRAAVRWMRNPEAPEAARALRGAALVFLLKAIYYLFVTPYALVRRVLLRKSLYRAPSGWVANPQSTADRSLFDKLV
jgi:hypothetical protein